MRNLSERLRQKREEMKATQEEFALILGKHFGHALPVQTYRKWEYGTRTPRGLYLKAIESFIQRKSLKPKQ